MKLSQAIKSLKFTITMTAVVIVKAAAQPTETSTNISLQRKLRPARSIQQEIFRLEGFNMAIIENRPTCWRESMAKTTVLTSEFYLYQ